MSTVPKLLPPLSSVSVSPLSPVSESEKMKKKNQFNLWRENISHPKPQFQIISRKAPPPPKRPSLAKKVRMALAKSQGSRTIRIPGKRAILRCPCAAPLAAVRAVLKCPVRPGPTLHLSLRQAARSLKNRETSPEWRRERPRERPEPARKDSPGIWRHLYVIKNRLCSMTCSDDEIMETKLSGKSPYYLRDKVTTQS